LFSSPIFVACLSLNVETGERTINEFLLFLLFLNYCQSSICIWYLSENSLAVVHCWCLLSSLLLTIEYTPLCVSNSIFAFGRSVDSVSVLLIRCDVTVRLCQMYVHIGLVCRT